MQMDMSSMGKKITHKFQKDKKNHENANPYNHNCVKEIQIAQEEKRK